MFPKFLLVSALILALVLSPAFGVSPPIKSLSPDQCGLLGRAAYQMTENIFAGNPVMTDIIVGSIDDFPEDVIEHIGLLEKVAIDVGKQLTPEDHGYLYIQFCFQNQGNIENMNKAFKEFLKYKDV